jgi:hypothetical protein
MYIYGIIEEYILLGFIQETNFPNIIQFCEKKYLAMLQTESQIDKKDITRKEALLIYSTKANCLNVIFTILLWILNKNLKQLLP